MLRNICEYTYALCTVQVDIGMPPNNTPKYCSTESAKPTLLTTTENSSVWHSHSLTLCRRLVSIAQQQELSCRSCADARSLPATGLDIRFHPHALNLYAFTASPSPRQGWCASPAQIRCTSLQRTCHYGRGNFKASRPTSTMSRLHSQAGIAACPRPTANGQ